MVTSFKDDVIQRKLARKRRVEQLAFVIERSPALIVSDGHGRRELVIVTGEMATPAEGRYRITYLMPDGPRGHDVRDSYAQIAELLAMDVDTYDPAGEAEVIAWTSTPEFVEGSKRVRFIQADNEYRWLASQAGTAAANEAYALTRRAHGVVATDGIDAGLAILEDAMRKLPKQNPRRRKAGKSWVARALADAYELLESKVPPQWLPKLGDVRPGPRATMIAKVIEYGCGAYGCVIPTLDPEVVLKLTTDDTESEFAIRLAHELVAPVCVTYHMAISLPAAYRGREIMLLWRDAAEHVGELERVLGKPAEELVAAQHAAAQVAYHQMRTGESLSGRSFKQDRVAWEDACLEMARVPELRPLADGLVQIYHDQGIFFGDIHAGNLGYHESTDRWLITDPGHVAVVSDTLRQNPPCSFDHKGAEVWKRGERIGVQYTPKDEYGPEEGSEGRLCPECRSSLWRPIDPKVAAILYAAQRVPVEWRFGDTKVFISDVYDQMQLIDGTDRGLSMDEWKAELNRYRQSGDIQLARADLVAAMPALKVERSEIDAGGAEFHFIVVARK